MTVIRARIARVLKKRDKQTAQRGGRFENWRGQVTELKPRNRR
jgi:hypothetical protein